MIFIYCVFPDKKEAEETADFLVRKKLAACCNIFPIESIYSWQKKIEKGGEVVAIIKTKEANFKKIEKVILKNHSYDTPCIIEIPLARITKKYLDWANKNIST